MSSLVGYGSDEDSNNSGDDWKSGGPSRMNYGRNDGRNDSRNYRKPITPHEDNYDEVGMDMSEDSESGNEKMEDAFTSERNEERGGSFRPSPPDSNRARINRKDSGSSKSSRDDRFDRHDRPQEKQSERKDGRNHDKSQEETWASRSERKKEMMAPRDNSKDKDEVRHDIRGRDERGDSHDRNKRNEDRHDRGDRNTRTERNDRGEKYERDRNERYKKDDRDRRDDRRDRRDDRFDRRERRRSRSRSRDRRRSRSPRRDRSPRRGPPMSKREKAAARMDRLDKLGIELNSSNSPQDFSSNEKAAPGSLLPPGVTGRFREQIEKRKLLWQKAKEEDSNKSSGSGLSKPAIVPIVSQPTMSVVSGSSKATKVYEATAFADDKQSSKFKRLMGIKDDTAPVAIKNTDVLKKQEEMFSSMEAQYEVARTATHTMRGVGLGFGSFQR